MKTSQLEAGTVYRLRSSGRGDHPALILDTRRRWRVRLRPPGVGVFMANGATVPDGYRAPMPDRVGVPALTLPYGDRSMSDERLARLLEAGRAILGAGDLPDSVELADLRVLIDAAVGNLPDARLITPELITPQNLPCPWPGVRGRAPLPEDVRYTIREETRS